MVSSSMYSLEEGGVDGVSSAHAEQETISLKRQLSSDLSSNLVCSDNYMTSLLSEMSLEAGGMESLTSL
jgi:hypothetical protein